MPGRGVRSTGFDARIVWPPFLLTLSLSVSPLHLHSSAKDLYAKFDELLEASSTPIKAGDRVTGTVTG